MNKRAGVPLLMAGVVFGLLVGLVASVAAQGAPWRIVHSSDGTLYVLKDGARFAIVGEEIDDEDLAAYPDGDAIGSTLLLNAVRPTTQSPAAQPVTQPAAVDGVVAEPVVEPAAAQPAPSRAVPASAKPTPTGAAPAAQAQSGADLQFVSVQGNTPGQSVSVTIQAREGVTCAIDYLTPTRVRSTAPGLGAQTVGASRTVTWSFVLDAAIRSGTGTLIVTCGDATINRAITLGGLSK